MSESLFITGGTGNIGAAILCDLIKRPANVRIAALVRGKSDSEARQRLFAALRVYRPNISYAEFASRIDVIPGDVTLPKLGIDSQRYALLCRDVSHIIHSAALTCFEADADEAERVNVGGTERVLCLAKSARNTGALHRMLYVSTAYVCGRKATGDISPDYLPPKAPPTNVYEQSKWRAEHAVRRHFGRLPLVIARPSIVVGDSTTGRIIHFNVLYPPLRLLLPHLRAGLKIGLHGILDVVPADYVASACRHLLLGQDIDVGRAYHVAAGSDHSRSVQDVLDAACQLIRSNGSGNRRSGADLLKILYRLKSYRPYLTFGGRFDCTATDKALAGTGLAIKPVTAFLDVLLDYCRRSKWGKSRDTCEVTHEDRCYYQPLLAYRRTA